MKHNNIKPTGNIDKDIAKAIARFSREEYGFKTSTMTKNKKKYNRKIEKQKLLRNSEVFYLYI